MPDPSGNTQNTRRVRDTQKGKPPKITGPGVPVKTGGPPSERTARWPKAPGGRQKKRPLGMPWVKNSVAGDY